MRNRAAIYPFELGFVVIVHAAGAVWTKHYSHDLLAVSDLHHVHLIDDCDTSPFMGEFGLPDGFDTVPLLESGFHRCAVMVH